MKKLLNIVFIFCALFFTSLSSYAGEVPTWKPPIVDVFIENSDYTQMMRNAFDDWCNASDRRFLFNLSSTKGMEKNGFVKVYFTTTSDKISVQHREGLRPPFVFVYINVLSSKGDVIPLETLYSKMLHNVGIIMGLDKSTNQSSVMYSIPSVNQKILEEDAVALFNLYGWKLPRNRPIIR